MPVRSIIIVLVIAVLASCGQTVRLRPAGPYTGPLKAGSIEKKIHKLINTERRDKGLGSLGLDKALSSIARDHSADMSEKGYFSHFAPDGSDFSHRYEKGGYSCRVTQGQTIYLGAENIFTIIFTGTQTGEQIARDTVKGWMASKGHRKNILTPHWGREGIGVSIGRDGQRVIVYITQNFC
jgi:uncharacterized protein YkwD